MVIWNQNISETFNTEHCLTIYKRENSHTVFAVEGEGEAVLLLFQFDMTLFHCLLQRYLGLKYGLNTLTHMEKMAIRTFYSIRTN